MKSAATVLPGHAAAMEKWIDLAGKRAAKRGILFADIAEPLSVTSRVRAVPWWWV